VVAKKTLKDLAGAHGTPLFVVDHRVLRKNYREFRKHLPRVQAYYAVKANPDPLIVETLYDVGASFDVASMPEFLIVHKLIEGLPGVKRQHFIWDKIIYSHPVKDIDTLRQLDQYKPLVVYDNVDEVEKIRKYAPQAGLVLRLKVPNTGSMVELSSKFGCAPADAVDLIAAGLDAGLVVEGIAFHVGSQCNNFENYMQSLEIAAAVFEESWTRGYEKVRILDIGGGFPAPYDENVQPFAELAEKLNAEFDRLFPRDMEILAEPGRYMVATAATVVAKIIGRAARDGKMCYYLDDGIYHTYSGILFDHCQYPVKSFKKGPTDICAVFGPTCDSLDTLSLAENLPPDLEIGDYLYSDNIGAYSIASATNFNGFPPPKVIHVNR